MFIHGYSSWDCYSLLTLPHWHQSSSEVCRIMPALTRTNCWSTWIRTIQLVLLIQLILELFNITGLMNWVSHDITLLHIAYGCELLPNLHFLGCTDANIGTHEAVAFSLRQAACQVSEVLTSDVSGLRLYFFFPDPFLWSLLTKLDRTSAGEWKPQNRVCTGTLWIKSRPASKQGLKETACFRPQKHGSMATNSYKAKSVPQA